LTVFKEIPHPSADVGKGKEKGGEPTRQGLHGPTTAIQYDYLQAYLDFFSEKPSIARDIALKYTEYPVPAWNKKYTHPHSHRTNTHTLTNTKISLK